MSPLAPPSWGRLFREFHCRECSGQQAYRSRPRGFFEKHVLPLLMLRPVRCEHCYHRGYVFRTVPALERAGLPGKLPHKSASRRLRARPSRCISFLAASILTVSIPAAVPLPFRVAGGRLQQYWVSNTGCPGPSSEPSVRPLGRARCCQCLLYAFSRRLPYLWFSSDSGFSPSRL